ncbi:ABC transporter permease [Streptomyces sp. JJ38]|uniref:ABC transporter permease n=1 Tax=Streptomyces sp. JJ38 TaxID=2738128 RepID=UPI001C572D6B|nr:ABC transporter permease [Streptomyces sp. JJ38]MBW1599699.1 ABC transporter permease [Streptomyces sp. JJ38]
MTTDQGDDSMAHPAEQHAPAGREAAKTLIQPLLIGLTVLILFLWIVGTAMHRPEPKDLPFGLVGPPQAVAQMEAQLDEKAPDALDITAYPDVETARAAVEDLEVYGAFAPGPQESTLIIASGAGPSPKNFVTQAFGGVAQQQGSQLTVDDVAPLPSGDPLANVAFFALLSATLASLVFQVVFYFRARGAGLGAWLGLSAAFSLLAGLTGAGLCDWAFNAYPGEFWPVTGMIALYTFTAVSIVAAFQVIGIPGIPLAVLMLVPFGVANSGGAVDRYFLGEPYHSFAEFVPSNAVVAGIRSVAYLDGAAVGVPLAVLTCWSLACVTVVALGRMLKGRKGGAGGPVPAPRQPAASTAPAD